MTIEEAITELGQVDVEFIFTARQKEAYKMAIKALETIKALANQMKEKKYDD